MSGYANGNYNERFTNIDKELEELKDSLAEAIRGLTGSITKQSESTGRLETSITLLTSQVTAAISVAQNSISLRAVIWMFLILVISILLILGGVEALKVMPKLVGLV
jgi:type II secretory pathway component PulL